MAGVLLDQYGGITETLHDDGDNQFTIKSVADVEPVVEAVKHLRDTSNDGRSASGDLYHVARVPMILVRKWNREYGCDVTLKENWELFKRLINSPEFKAFRIYQGKI